METKPIKREWVKNAAIVFLIVLLILTFFSNTIRNASLPEVATQMVSSNSISQKVRGSGTVEASGIYEVKMKQTFVLKAVMVRAGMKVEPGDVLFVLGEGDSKELEAAQDELDRLQTSYQSALMSAPSYDYTQQERQIEKAKTLWDEAQANLKTAKLLFEATNPNYAERLSAAEKKLDEASTALDTAIDEYCAAAGIRVDSFDVKKHFEDFGWRADGMYSEDEIKEKLENNETLAQANVTAAQEKLAELAALTERTEEQDTALAQAQLELDRAGDARKLAEKELPLWEAFDKTQKALALRAEILASGGEELQGYRDAIAAAENAKESYDNLVYSLERQKVSDGQSAGQAYLGLQNQLKDIEKQKALIEELSGGTENQITAPVGGTIGEVSFTAGQTAPSDSTLCTIEVPDMGYTMQITVTADQAKRLRVGDSGTVSTYYWGPTITATITSIKNDPKNPQSSRIVTFDLDGETTAGATLSVSIGSRSSNFDTVIPNSAIRTDSNGSFVLAIEAKNSPLGNNYYARRVSIEVLAEDDVNSAVTGDLSYGDFVITTSGAPVKNGDMVRMAD